MGSWRGAAVAVIGLALAACAPRIVERPVAVPALGDWSPETQREAAAEVRACEAATGDVDAILATFAVLVEARDQARALETADE